MSKEQRSDSMIRRSSENRTRCKMMLTEEEVGSLSHSNLTAEFQEWLSGGQYHTSKGPSRFSKKARPVWGKRLSEDCTRLWRFFLSSGFLSAQSQNKRCYSGLPMVPAIQERSFEWYRLCGVRALSFCYKKLRGWIVPEAVKMQQKYLKMGAW